MKRLMLSALVVAACAISPSARAFEWLPLFQIRAMSMNPTLLDGDYVLAPSAGVATSLPRGQIVMYRNPKHQERTDVKRIVGRQDDHAAHKRFRREA